MGKKRGAPPKPPGQRKAKLIAFRMSFAEFAEIKAAAGHKVSAWMRETLLRAARNSGSRGLRSRPGKPAPSDGL
jgi:hypothetical protein